MRRHDSARAASSRSGLPADLTAAIARAGYYPALVCDVVEAAVGDDDVHAHLVHLETTFDQNDIKRHVTVLALTPSCLVVAHADDHEAGQPDEAPTVATATTEVIPLGCVRGVMLTHVVNRPETFTSGTHDRDLTLTIGWGAVSRVDLLPAQCGDPECVADHGYEGTIAGDDISLRISSAAEGEQAVRDAMAFSRALTRAVGRAGGPSATGSTASGSSVTGADSGPRAGGRS